MVERRHPAVAYLITALDRAESDAYLIEGGGGYEPQVWRTEPSRSGHWMEVVSLSRMLGDPPETAARCDDQPVMLVRTGRGEHEHVARYDPAWIVRRVQADKRILAEHAPDSDNPKYCRTCTTTESRWAAPVAAKMPCATVLALAEAWGWETTRWLR
jgi:hypothetical protein